MPPGRSEDISDLGKIDRYLADISQLRASTSIALTPDAEEALVTLEEDLRTIYHDLMELLEAD